MSGTTAEVSTLGLRSARPTRLRSRLLEVENDADDPTSREQDVGEKTNEPALKR
jgi:hypothetical protein